MGSISKGQDFLRLKTGRIGCPETSERNYKYLLRNNPEERRAPLFSGGSLKYWCNKIVYRLIVIIA